MTKNAQKPAKSSRDQAKTNGHRTSLFNLIKRTATGRTVICRDLTFQQATSIAAEIPAAVLKFSRMEAIQ